MFKKIVALVVAGVFAVGIVGCATVQVEAPAGSNIRSASANTMPSHVIKKRVYYLIGGLIPLTPNTTSQMLTNQNAKEVSIKAYNGVVDYIIFFLTGGIVTSRTVEIHVK